MRDHPRFERTAFSKKPEYLIAADLAALRDEDRMTPGLVFRDPYFLDFLGLSGGFLEKEVEQAILRELESFILELGGDFAFVARQKRSSVDHKDYYLDLEKSEEHVELLQLDKSGIRVAKYLNELPPRELLVKTLHNSVQRARERLVFAERASDDNRKPAAKRRTPRRVPKG